MWHWNNLKSLYEEYAWNTWMILCYCYWEIFKIVQDVLFWNFPLKSLTLDLKLCCNWNVNNSYLENQLALGDVLFQNISSNIIINCFKIAMGFMIETITANNAKLMVEALNNMKGELYHNIHDKVCSAKLSNQISSWLACIEKLKLLN